VHEINEGDHANVFPLRNVRQLEPPPKHAKRDARARTIGTYDAKRLSRGLDAPPICVLGSATVVVLSHRSQQPQQAAARSEETSSPPIVIGGACAHGRSIDAMTCVGSVVVVVLVRRRGAPLGTVVRNCEGISRRTREEERDEPRAILRQHCLGVARDPSHDIGIRVAGGRPREVNGDPPSSSRPRGKKNRPGSDRAPDFLGAHPRSRSGPHEPSRGRMMRGGSAREARRWWLFTNGEVLACVRVSASRAGSVRGVRGSSAPRAPRAIHNPISDPPPRIGTTTTSSLRSRGLAPQLPGSAMPNKSCRIGPGRTNRIRFRLFLFPVPPGTGARTPGKALPSDRASPHLTVDAVPSVAMGWTNGRRGTWRLLRAGRTVRCSRRKTTP
jgi:hypothetical protein